MSKDAFIAAHEQLISEYLDAHPGADWHTAYEATADPAYNRMRENLADRADMLRTMRKEGLI